MSEQNEAPSPRWLTVADVARALAVDPSCVYKLARGGKIGYSRIGTGAGRIRFTPANLAAYLESIAVAPKDPKAPSPLPEGAEASLKWFPVLAAKRVGKSEKPARWTQPQGSKPTSKAKRTGS